MTDRVDASMQAMEPSGGNAASNGGRRKAELAQLREGHDAVLMHRDTRKVGVPPPSVTFRPVFRRIVTLTKHPVDDRAAVASRPHGGVATGA